jgi:hypothetical protein
LPRRRRVKPQWTEPIILVPIIAAVITAIVSPIVVPIIQDLLKGPKPPDDGPLRNGAAALHTDKNSYGVGDYVKVDGTVDKPRQGKTVRLDVYDPKGKVFEPFNETFSTGAREDRSPAYPRLSDVQVKPNDKGLFSYRFPVDNTVGGPIIKGTYKIEVTYEGATKNATFTVR